MDSDVLGFRVDNFRKVPPGVNLVFLTHFHADHYDGITDALTQRGDLTVYCTEITRRLVLTRFRVPREQVQPLQMCEPRLIDADIPFTVIALPANHCPGSAAFLFEFSNGSRWLHTGDFRYTKEMQDVDVWKRVMFVDKLFLDTTFCNKQRFANFPTKNEAQEQIVNLIQKHMSSKTAPPGRCLNVYLRCQSFGTEEVFLRIKERLGIKTQISSELYAALIQADSRFKDAVCEEGGAESNNACAVHVCNEFPQKRESESLYLRVSAQWSQFSARSDIEKPKLLDGVWNVLYSGHSSWNELYEFVSFVQAKSIEPLVPCDVPSFRLLKESQNGNDGGCLSPPQKRTRVEEDTTKIEQERLYDDVMKLLDEYNSNK